MEVRKGESKKMRLLLLSVLVGNLITFNMSPTGFDCGVVLGLVNDVAFLDELVGYKVDIPMVMLNWLVDHTVVVEVVVGDGHLPSHVDLATQCQLSCNRSQIFVRRSL